MSFEIIAYLKKWDVVLPGALTEVKNIRLRNVRKSKRGHEHTVMFKCLINLVLGRGNPYIRALQIRKANLKGSLYVVALNRETHHYC